MIRNPTSEPGSSVPRARSLSSAIGYLHRISDRAGLLIRCAHRRSVRQMAVIPQCSRSPLLLSRDSTDVHLTQAVRYDRAHADQSQLQPATRWPVGSVLPWGPGSIVIPMP